MVFCDIGPKRNHQLVGFTPEGEQVNISHEVRKIFLYFFTTSSLGVIAAAIQGNVDSEDYVSHLIALPAYGFFLSSPQEISQREADASRRSDRE